MIFNLMFFDVVHFVILYRLLSELEVANVTGKVSGKERPW